MIFTVVCALILCDEASAYTMTGLAAVFGFTSLCCLGIYTVTLKNSAIALNESNEHSDDYTAQSEKASKKEASDEKLPLKMPE